MTRDFEMGRVKGSPGRNAGSLSMISILAISVGMAAAPAQAQEATAPVMSPPVQAPPLMSPQPAPPSQPATSPTLTPTISPTIAAPPASSPPVVKARPASPVTPERADDLARKGGFDAETVAPEALAQIEQEQQQRQAAAAEAAAAKRAASARSSATSAGSPATGSAGDSLAEGVIARPEAAIAAGTADAQFGGQDAAATAVASPATQSVPQTTASPDAVSGEAGADWGLLAALAALLGIGGAGAYAASRRRKNKGELAAATYDSDPVPATLTAAAAPMAKSHAVEPEADPAADDGRIAARTPDSKAAVKADFAQFVAKLPAFDSSDGKPDRSVTLGQRRVAAAPKPYLAQADMARTAGYFTANVDAMPTPQNPFLTRQKRLKRARYLDSKLAAMNAGSRESRTKFPAK
ncbi:hypothetical protein C8024_18575, partial [Sphingopyxis sp. BSNA05]|nr:hypothetical protein [Sphingopyxis sp. BSNA05]